MREVQLSPVSHGCSAVSPNETSWNTLNLNTDICLLGGEAGAAEAAGKSSYTCEGKH